MFCLLLDLVGWMCGSVYPSTDVWFSVSRSFTVGNGVRADILCGRRDRAGVPRAGLSAGSGGAGSGRRRGPRPGAALPQAAGGATSGPARSGEEAARGGERRGRCPRRRRGRGRRGGRAPGGRVRRRGQRRRGRRPGPARLPGPWPKVNSRLRSRPGKRGPDSAPRPARESGARGPCRSHARGRPGWVRAQRRCRAGRRRARHAAPRPLGGGQWVGGRQPRGLSIHSLIRDAGPPPPSRARSLESRPRLFWSRAPPAAYGGLRASVPFLFLCVWVLPEGGGRTLVPFLSVSLGKN